MKANKKSVQELKQDEDALMFNLLLTAGITVIIFFALMNIGIYINGQVGESLIDTYPATGRTDYQEMVLSNLNNTTADFGAVLNIMSVTAIIMVITLPLAAIVAVKRLI